MHCYWRSSGCPRDYSTDLYESTGPPRNHVANGEMGESDMGDSREEKLYFLQRATTHIFLYFFVVEYISHPPSSPTTNTVGRSS